MEKNNNDDSSGEEKEKAFVFQHISVVIQRFISVLLQESFVNDD